MGEEGSVGEESSQAGMTSLAPRLEQTEGVEYTYLSVTGRENRNKAMLLKERRERLKEKRMNGFIRCDKVSSKQVGQEWVQDRSRPMVVI